MTPDPEPLVDAELAAFLQRGIGIGAAACDRSMVPTLARAIGCRISSDRHRVTIFISATQAAPVLKCIRDNRAIAVVFSEPSTHRAVQLKGKDASVGGLADGDLQIVADYRNAFVRELGPLGIDEILVRALLSCPSADIVGLSFTPSEAYSQTPGPQAGEPLKACT